jgi:hypothetical protein
MELLIMKKSSNMILKLLAEFVFTPEKYDFVLYNKFIHY